MQLCVCLTVPCNAATAAALLVLLLLLLLLLLACIKHQLSSHICDALTTSPFENQQSTAYSVSITEALQSTKHVCSVDSKRDHLVHVATDMARTCSLFTMITT
jgi:hypothetical protein